MGKKITTGAEAMTFVEFYDINGDRLPLNHRIVGTYSIDNLYVGKSGSSVRLRIKRHLIETLSGRHCNERLSKHLLQKIDLEKSIIVKILSYRDQDESFFVRELKPSFNLPVYPIK